MYVFPFAVTIVPPSVLAWHPVFYSIVFIGVGIVRDCDRVCMCLRIVSMPGSGREKVRNVGQVVSKSRWSMMHEGQRFSDHMFHRVPPHSSIHLTTIKEANHLVPPNLPVRNTIRGCRAFLIPNATLTSTYCNMEKERQNGLQMISCRSHRTLLLCLHQSGILSADLTF